MFRRRLSFFGGKSIRDYFMGKSEAGLFAGRVYFVTWRADCLTMYVNTEELARHGLEAPETMEDLLAAAAYLHDLEGRPRVGMKAKKYEGLMCEIALFVKAYGGD